MAVYRFRVTFEDNEEIYRDIEIKSTQNFEDFHFIILQSIGFDSKHSGSFFISDDYWRKGDEIILRVDEEDNAKRKRKDLPLKKQMNKCKMVSLIDDPHQKFVYTYDPAVEWTLMVELMKILPDDAKITYPRIAKSVEAAPKQYIVNNIVPAIEDEDFDEEEEAPSDDEAYTNATVDEEISTLESEEGEEEEEEAADEDMDAGDLEDTAEADYEED